MPKNIHFLIFAISGLLIFGCTQTNPASKWNALGTEELDCLWFDSQGKINESCSFPISEHFPESWLKGFPEIESLFYLDKDPEQTTIYVFSTGCTDSSSFVFKSEKGMVDNIEPGEVTIFRKYPDNCKRTSYVQALSYSTKDLKNKFGENFIIINEIAENGWCSRRIIENAPHGCPYEKEGNN